MRREPEVSKGREWPSPQVYNREQLLKSPLMRLREGETYPHSGPRDMSLGNHLHGWNASHRNWLYRATWTKRIPDKSIIYSREHKGQMTQIQWGKGTCIIGTIVLNSQIHPRDLKDASFVPGSK